MTARMTNARQRNLYGVGFAGLSLSNLDGALRGEIMTDKELGLFAVCAPSDGTAMSFEYISRSKAHLQSFIQQCIEENTVGKIYKIALHDKLIERILDNKNLFTNDVLIDLGVTPATAIRFNFDIDVVSREASAVVDPGEIYISIEFSLVRDGEPKNYSLIETIEDINSKAYAIDFDQVPHAEGIDIRSLGIRVNAMYIRIPPSFDFTKNMLVINDILMAII